MQIDGKNWIVPVDAQIQTKTDLSLHTNAMHVVIEQMTSKSKINLVFMDACRDNPFVSKVHSDTRSANQSRGLSRIGDSEGDGELYVAFATAAGEVALDGDGNYSPFSEAILRHIKTPEIDINELMRRVRKEVKSKTSNKKIRQIPWSNTALTEQFYFAGSPLS